MAGIELLAPAGDLERLEAAIRFGADSVYMGGPLLQLRAGVVGFTAEGLEQAVDIAHKARKRLYVTVNAFAKSGEIDSAGHYAKELFELGADAVIVSDLGVLRAVKKSAPDLEVHISTQANCMNYMAARTYHELGASRIILARELSLAEIAELRAKTPKELELEAFVHGAMCMSYSGRCLLSAYFNNRSGNRGECTQPCRWQYHLTEQNRPGEFFQVEAYENGTAILSSYDLNCIEIIDEIIAAGVSSLKIEGRMKSPYYVATVVNAYRRALDKSADMQTLKNELDAASHRPYCTGFYYGEMRGHNPGDTPYMQDCEFTAAVKGRSGDLLEVQQRNRFKVGDELEILSPNSLGNRFTVEKIYDAERCELESAQHPMQRVRINCPYPLQNGDMLRRRL